MQHHLQQLKLVYIRKDKYLIYKSHKYAQFFLYHTLQWWSPTSYRLLIAPSNKINAT